MATTEQAMFPDLDSFFRDRGLRTRGGEWLEDSYDYGVWWMDENRAVYRLTWIGPVHRDEGASGELYLVRLSGPVIASLGADAFSVSVGQETGAVELLCTVPPADCDVCGPGGGLSVHYHDPKPNARVEALLEGWGDVCGSVGSVGWLRDRAAEARLLWPDAQR